MPARTPGLEGGVDYEIPSRLERGKGVETSPSIRVLKTLRESPKRTISTSGGHRLDCYSFIYIIIWSKHVYT